MVVRAVSLLTTDLSTHGLSATLSLIGIRSLVGFGKDLSPLAHPVLYPRWIYVTLYLNRFRGEPAISEFDWPFTPSHRSSPSIATDVGSVLQYVLPHLQPAHG